MTTTINNESRIRELAANWTQKTRIEQIVARHEMHDLSELPNREYTASWLDVQELRTERDGLIADVVFLKSGVESQSEHLTKLTTQRNHYWEQVEVLSEALREAAEQIGFMEQALEEYHGTRKPNPTLATIDAALATVEQENAS